MNLLNKHSLYIKFHNSEIIRKLLSTNLQKIENLGNSGKPGFEFKSSRILKKKKEREIFLSKGWNHPRSKGDTFTIEPFQMNGSQIINDMNFTDLGLKKSIVNILNINGFNSPSEIQMKAIPLILQEKNVILNAETGSGKTLAYVLPLIQNILNIKSLKSTNKKLNHPTCLIICPSRELVDQIGEVLKIFENPLNLFIQTLTGGHTKKIIFNPFFNEIDILVSTLGALSKLVTFNILKMSDLRYIVIDETDTMLDDSFNEKLINFLNRQGFDETTIGSAQITLVSATKPKNIDSILDSIIDTSELEHITTDQLHCLLPNVQHKFLRITKDKKPIELLKILKKNKKQTIVFSNSSETCDFINILLNENGIKSINLNGNMTTKLRDGQLKRFINQECQVLSCTDIGSRGLNFPYVNNIINYDCPIYTADYLHRSGRTGRLCTIKNDKEISKVTTFVVTPDEVKLVQNIEQSARKMEPLKQVNGNIKSIINKKLRVS